MNLKGAVAAAKAFVDAGLGDVAPTEEIARRAAICNQCPKRKRATGLPARISRLMGVMTIRDKEKSLKPLTESKCGVCSCSLMLLVPALPENLHEDSPKEAAERPAKCWFNDTKR